MIKKILVLFCAVVMILTCFSACKKDGDNGEFFACGITEMPEHFDPQIAKTTSEKMVAVNIFDGLFKLCEDNKIEKCAVKDYSVSDDGLVYTFYIREDMKYYLTNYVKNYLEEKQATINQILTAEDFAFGIIRGILPETDAPDYELLSDVKNANAVHSGKMSADSLGVRVIDNYTLEITLEKASSDFLYALTQPISYPCHKQFFEITGGRYGLDEKYLISNGGFVLDEYNEDKSVIIVKNKEYKGSFDAKPSGVGFYLNSSTAQIAEKVDDGTYDVGFFQNESDKDELGRSVIKNEFQNRTCSLIFNMKDEFMQNSTLRTGLIACIDLTAVSDNPLNSVLPAFYEVDNSAVENISYSIDNARSNMIKAYDSLDIETLDLEILCMPEYESIAKALVNSWQKNIGVELNGIVTVAEKDEYTKKLASGEYDAAIYSMGVDSNKASDFLAMFTTDNSENVFNYSSAEFDRLANDLKSSYTNEKAVYCQSYLLKNAVILPLYAETTIYAVHKGSEGVYFSGDSSNLYFCKGQK